MMMSKKILIISRSFYPQNSPRSFRATELAKEFARQGHEVTVLTLREIVHGDFEKEYGLKIDDLSQQVWPAIELKGKGLGLFIRRGLRRAGQLLLEYPNLEFYFKTKKALKKKRKAGERYDLLLSIAVPYPIHWGVAAVWKGKNKIANRWVADCGDPFMGRENDTFRPAFYFKYIEKRFCRKADYLTVPVKTAIPAYYPEFREKIRVIPQGFNFEEVKIADKEQSSCPHFAYAGGFIPGRRDPTAFLDYLIKLDQPFRFDIYTRSKHLVAPFVDRSGGRIRVKDYLPRKTLLFELSKLDFVVNFDNKGLKQIPSKLIDYAIIDKPILNISGEEFDRQNVDAFLAGHYENAFVVQDVAQYKIENVVQKFLALL